MGKRKAETSEASGGLERKHDGLAKLREAELSEQQEHSPIHFPFNPSSWRMQTNMLNYVLSEVVSSPVVDVLQKFGY